jgi:pimeloyl-ACP methyl ester carboxylesterase
MASSHTIQRSGRTDHERHTADPKVPPTARSSRRRRDRVTRVLAREAGRWFIEACHSRQKTRREPQKEKTTMASRQSEAMTKPYQDQARSQVGAGMKQIELSAGSIEYEDTGGDGPVLVLLHGLMMDASLWDGPIARLSADHRCVAPTLPLGAHRHAMHADADLSLPGIARLVAEFLDRLDLQDVTLVGNDTGGALVQLLMGQDADRVGRVVLASCDAFDNFPPGLTGRTLVLTGKLPPPVFGLFMQQMRLRALRRLPIAFGWLTKRGDEATARWIKPVTTQPEIRRDAVRVLRAAAADAHFLLEAAECLPSFHRPALMVWASGDRVMPPEHGRRLAGLLPQGRLIEVDDSYTLIPLDQPARFAQIVREFTHASGKT